MKSNGESVTIRVEYQWLPPKCPECNVFGHKCSPKVVPAPTSAEEVSQTIGKQATISNKDFIIQRQVQMALENGGSAALDAVTREVASSSSLLHKNVKTSSPPVSKEIVPLGIADTGLDLDSSDEIEEIIADTCILILGTTSTFGSITEQLTPDPKPPYTPAPTSSGSGKLEDDLVHGGDFKVVSNKKKKKGRSKGVAFSPNKGR